MKFRNFLFLGAALVATLSLTANAAEKIYAVSGVIRVPVDTDGRIAVAHDDIPGFMPAMTMRFVVGNPAEAAALKPGDQVRFRLHVGESASTATDFLVTGAASPADPAPSIVSVTKPRVKRVGEGDAVPAFSLVTESGEPFSIEQLRGHFTVITFIFTRCPVPEYCPAMAFRFAELQKAIATDPKLVTRARLLSITLDPEFDRPDVLKSYGEAIGARSAIWQFATGSKEQIELLTKSFSVFTERNGITLDHTLCTALIDESGRIVEIWRGNGWRSEEILVAISAAMQANEAAGR